MHPCNEARLQDKEVHLLKQFGKKVTLHKNDITLVIKSKVQINSFNGYWYALKLSGHFVLTMQYTL